MKKITFTLHSGYVKTGSVADIYYPIPASKQVPEWYKKLPASHDISSLKASSDTETIKRCMPVFDILTSGYFIKTYTDIEISKDKDGTVKWDWSSKYTPLDPVTSHPQFQLMGYKDKINESLVALKFTNPFSIITPEGYSVLIINPPHRQSWGGKIMEGIVDTDKYYAPINFPFILDSGFEGLIPAGTIIAQVIPFRRDSFEMKIGGEKERKMMETSSAIIRSVFVNGYKLFLRTKKTYQ
jgi:hypothetical protein